MLGRSNMTCNHSLICEGGYDIQEARNAAPERNNAQLRIVIASFTSTFVMKRTEGVSADDFLLYKILKINGNDFRWNRSSDVQPSPRMV